MKNLFVFLICCNSLAPFSQTQNTEKSLSQSKKELVGLLFWFKSDFKEKKYFGFKY